MKEFRSQSLADQVFEKLENDIVFGVYPRGEVLTELKLVEQLGVSRTPIREALRRLEQERLIRDTGKGSLVLGITEEDLMDILDIRVHVEALASYYAARNLTREGAGELKHIVELQEFYYSKWDPEHLRQMDDKFHDTICLLGGRMVITDTLQPLHRKTRRFRRLALDSRDRASLTLKEHRAIFDAIMDRDGHLASKLTAQHISNAKEHMIKELMNHG